MTQTESILKHLKSGNSINPLQSLSEYKCLRLGARIYDLKRLGFDIKSRFIKVNSGKEVKEYYI